MQTISGKSILVALFLISVLIPLSCKKETIDNITPPSTIKGCMDKQAINYNSAATVSDTCIYKNETFISAGDQQNQMMSESMYLVSNVDNNVSPTDGVRMGKSYISASNPCLFVDRSQIINKTLILHFGYNQTTQTYSDCICPDSIMRRGKISILFSGVPFEIGTKLTISTENYFINKQKLDLSLGITNNDTKAFDRTLTIAGPYSKDSLVNSGAFYLVDGSLLTALKGELNLKTKSLNIQTLTDRSDDELTINGWGDGWVKELEYFDLKATNLLLKGGCYYLTSGITELKTALYSFPVTLKVDYDPKANTNECTANIANAGQSPCDSIACVKVDNSQMTTTCEICNKMGNTSSSFTYLYNGQTVALDCSACKDVGCIYTGHK